MSLNGRLNADLRTIFAEALNVVVPDDDADLINGGLLDSLGLVELIMEIEHRFGVSVPLDTLDIDDFRTVDRIAAFVRENEAAAR